MKFKWAIVLAIVAMLAVVCALYGADTTKRPAATAKASQWEYLVVTGKARFSVSQPGSEAVLHKPIGEIYPFVEQAAMLQIGMDELGKQGWELVTVVGAIGGDQEFIFKRRP